MLQLRRLDSYQLGIQMISAIKYDPIIEKLIIIPNDNLIRLLELDTYQVSLEYSFQLDGKIEKLIFFDSNRVFIILRLGNKLDGVFYRLHESVVEKRFPLQRFTNAEALYVRSQNRIFVYERNVGFLNILIPDGDPPLKGDEVLISNLRDLVPLKELIAIHCGSYFQIMDPRTNRLIYKSVPNRMVYKILRSDRTGTLLFCMDIENQYTVYDFADFQYSRELVISDIIPDTIEISNAVLLSDERLQNTTESRNFEIILISETEIYLFEPYINRLKKLMTEKTRIIWSFYDAKKQCVYLGLQNGDIQKYHIYFQSEWTDLQNSCHFKPIFSFNIEQIEDLDYNSLKVSEDLHYLIGTKKENILCVFDLQNGSLLYDFAFNDYGIDSFDFFSQTTLCILLNDATTNIYSNSSKPPKIVIYSIRDNRILSEYGLNSMGTIHRIASISESKRFISVLPDNIIEIYSISELQLMNKYQIKEIKDPILVLAAFNENQVIVCSESTIGVYDLKNNQGLIRKISLSERPLNVQIDEQNQQIILVFRDSISLVNGMLREIHKINLSSEYKTPRYFVQKENYIFFSDDKNRVFVVDLVNQTINLVYSSMNRLKLLPHLSYWVFISEYDEKTNQLKIQVLSKMQDIEPSSEIVSKLLFDPQMEILNRIETLEPTGSLQDFFFLPNTSLLILLHRQKGPILWDFIENRLVDRFDPPPCSVDSADIHGISNALIACSNSEHLVIYTWNLFSKRVSRSFIGAKSGVTKIRLSSSGLYIGICYIDGTLDIMNAFNYRVVFSIENTQKIQDFCFTFDNKSIITVDNTGSAKLWNFNSLYSDLEDKFILLYKSNEVPNLIHINRADSLLFLGYLSGIIDIIDLAAQTLLKKLEFCRSPIQFMYYEEETKDLFFAEYSGFLIRYNIENMDMSPFTRVTSPIIRARYDPINKLIFLLTWDASITVFNSLTDLSKQIHYSPAKKVIPPIPFSERANIILALDTIDFPVQDAQIKNNSKELLVVDHKNTLWNINLLTMECFEKTLIQNKLQSYKVRSIFQNAALNYYITIPLDVNDPILYFHEFFDEYLGRIVISEPIIKPIVIDAQRWVFVCPTSVIFWNKKGGIQKTIKKNLIVDGIYLSKYNKIVILSENELEFLSLSGVTEKIVRLSSNPIKCIYSEQLNMIFSLDKAGILHIIDPINMEIFSSHTLFASCVDFELSIDSNYFAFAIGSNILIVSTDSFKTIKTYNNESATIKKIFRSIDGYYLISIDKEGRLRIWNFDIHSSISYFQLIQNKKYEYILPIYPHLENQNYHLFESELTVSHPLATFLTYDQKTIVIVDISGIIYEFGFTTRKLLNLFRTGVENISYCETLNEFEIGMISVIRKKFILFNLKSKKISQYNLPEKLEHIKIFKKSNTPNCFFVSNETHIFKIRYPEMKIIESISIQPNNETIIRFEVTDQDTNIFILTSLNNIYAYSHTGQKRAEFLKHGEDFSEILYNPETRTICASTTQGILYVLHAYTLKNLKIIEGIPNGPIILKNIPHRDEIVIVQQYNHELLLVSLDREDFESLPLPIKDLKPIIHASLSYCLNFVIGITINGKIIIWNLQSLSKYKKRELSELKAFAYSHLTLIEHPSLDSFIENRETDKPRFSIHDISSAEAYKPLVNKDLEKNTKEMIEITALSLKVSEISLIQWIPELELLAVASDNGKIVCNYLNQKNRQFSFQCEQPVVFMRYSRVINSIIIISGIFSGRVQIFSMDQMKLIFDQKYSKEIYKAFDLSPDHKYLCLVENNRLLIFNLLSLNISKAIKFSDIKLETDVSWTWYLSNDSILLLSISGEAIIYQLWLKQTTKKQKICTHPIKNARLGEDRTHLVIYLENNSIQLLEIPSFKILNEFSSFSNNINAFAYSDLNNLIGIGTFEGNLLFCFCDTNEMIVHKKKFSRSLTQLEFNPYGDFLFCVSADNVITALHVAQKIDPFLSQLRYLRKGLLNAYQSQEAINLGGVSEQLICEQLKWSNIQKDALLILKNTGEILVFNTRTRKKCILIPDCTDSCFKQSDSGRYLIISNTAKRNIIKIFDLFLNKIIFSYTAKNLSIIDYCFLEKAHRLILCSNTKKMIEIQIDTNVINEITLDIEPLLVISDEDSIIYFTDSSGSIYKKSENKIEKIFQYNIKINSLLFYKQANTIIAIDETDLIIFFDLFLNQLKNAVRFNSMKGVRGELTHDGDLILVDSYCSFGRLSLFGKQVSELRSTYLGALKDFSVSLDANYLAISSESDANIFPIKQMYNRSTRISEHSLPFGLLPIKNDFPPFHQIKFGNFNQYLFLLSQEKDHLYCYRLKDLSIAHDILFKPPYRIHSLIDCGSERYLLFGGVYENLESHILLDIITKEIKPVSVNMNKRESLNSLAQITSNFLLYFVNDNDHLEIYDLATNKSIRTLDIPEIIYFKVKEQHELLLVLSENTFEYTIHLISLNNDFNETIKIDKDVHELIESIDVNNNFDLLLHAKNDSILYHIGQKNPKNPKNQKNPFHRICNGYCLEEERLFIEFSSIHHNEVIFTQLKVKNYDEETQNELFLTDFGFNEVLLSAFQEYIILFNTIRAELFKINKHRSIDLTIISDKEFQLEKLKKTTKALNLHFEKIKSQINLLEKEVDEEPLDEEKKGDKKKSTGKKSTKRSTKKQGEPSFKESNGEKKSTHKRKKSSG